MMYWGVEQLIVDNNQIKNLSLPSKSGPGNDKNFYLSFQRNQIEKILVDFNDYSHIRSLKLSGNAITNITNVTTHLTNLMILDLSFNDLRSLANDSFRRMGNLRELILHHTNLTDIDNVNWSGNKNLGHLDVSHNQLRKFNIQLNAFEKLKSVKLNDNYLNDTFLEEFSKDLKSLANPEVRAVDAVEYCSKPL